VSDTVAGREVLGGKGEKKFGEWLTGSAAARPPPGSSGRASLR